VKIKLISIFNLLWFCLFQWGCSGLGRQTNWPPQPSPSQPLPQPHLSSSQDLPVRPPGTDGSLWEGSLASGYLFVDPKARSVGDIVTIQIMEEASASGKASTKAGKKSSLSAGISSLFGLEQSVVNRNANVDPASLLNASTDNNFDSSGQISRSGKITATITARVTQVLSNGNLVIRGTRQVTINNEQQLLIIQGIIRSEDISPGNIIASTSIADAQIIYTGKGVVSDKQSPGWLSRVVDSIWPF
jgi:flagellar L-ring protein precursor FlgH